MSWIPKDWAELGGLAASIGLFAAAFAAWAAYKQLVELVRTRKLEALSRVFDLISSVEARRARRFVMHELASPPDSITPRERDAIEQIAVDFERIGSLVRLGLVPQAELLAHHAPVIARTWQRLEPYLEYRAKVLGGNYAHNFRWLGKEAQGHLHRMGEQGVLPAVRYVPDVQVRRRVKGPK